MKTKIHFDSRFDGESGKFAAVVKPGPGSRVEPFTSEPLFESHEHAVIAGIKHVEAQGFNINWHAIAELLA
ncbi:hypothetical protein [Roseateles sp.]|uniref:hypothetical protein n=1 Tax=Roseateles sp. TaxID=1971397 RepID=UPI003D10548F